ncbi:MAG TPA: hypothetical protein VEY07_05115 [Thermoplasmata archaeon]|nr:hypothetical protein [Thermoplasmata archaeon]
MSMEASARWWVLGIVVAAIAVAAAVAVAPMFQPVGNGGTQHVAVTIAWNSSSGGYSYYPSSIHVPAGSTVTLTITNFDPVNHTVASQFCRVNGTLDGTMWYGMGPSMMGSIGMHRGVSLPVNGVSHTFTMSGAGFHLNVPIPPAVGSSDPAVVTVTFHAPLAGMLSWQCEAMGSAGSHGMMGSFYSD